MNKFKNLLNISHKMNKSQAFYKTLLKILIIITKNIKISLKKFNKFY